MKAFGRLIVALIVFLGVFPYSARAQSAGWFNSSWVYRNPITITNTSGSALTNFQVDVTLGSSFAFANAIANGSDVRMTASDGVTQLPFWIESWNPSGQTASIWVQVPSVPTSGATVYLYYGNPAATSASNGNATFMFFDDFDSTPQTPGYWTLGAAQTVLVQDQSWEDYAPHTLSVLQLNMGGHTYWGYYGLQAGCGGIGVAYSEDLVTWTKEPTNPIITNARWPSVVQIGSTLYMVHDKNYCSTPELDLATSTDGINWTDVEQLVPPNYLGMEKNQNANLWLNPNDGKYYLYWYNGDGSTVWNIMARSATSPTGLNSNASEVQMMTAESTLAAPDMMYYNGTYFLSTEVLDANGLWNVWVYSSTTGPTSGFTPLPGNPVLNNGAACMFQTVFGTTLHEYYCQLTGSTWTVQHRQADLTSTRPSYNTIDPTKWTAGGPLWYPVTDTQQNGTTGLVAQGTISSNEIMYSSSFTGTNYILEAYGKQLQGDVWGLGFRVNNTSNFYSLNLYDNLNGSPNLYSYLWTSANSTTLGDASVGTVNPNTWYKLSVRAQGSTFAIYKDGVFQFQTSDATFPSGGIALYGETNTLANFNNVLVRQYASVDPTTTVGPLQSGTSSISSVSLNPTSVTGGAGNSTGTVTLTLGAPAGGAVVTLSSSNLSAATVPPSVSVPANATSGTFTVTSNSVATTASSTITATYKATQTATLTVTPLATAVVSVNLNPTSVLGGVANSTATVTLNGTAPASGTTVTLKSSNTAAATVPISVTVPANTSSTTFTITSVAVNSTTSVTITASFGGSATATLTVTPPSVTSLSLNPTSVTGGVTNSTGTVTLSAPAPSGGATVALSSSNKSAATVPVNVPVPAGTTTATFTATSLTVTSTLTTTITATYNGSATAVLTVNPVVVVPPVAFARAAGNSGESVKYTVTIAPAAGDFLAVFVWQTEGATTPTVTDNLSSAYTADCSLTLDQGFGPRLLSVYHLLKAGAGITGVSVTPNRPSRTIVAEYSGMPSNAGLDVCGTVNNQTTTVTSWSSPATTTTTTNLVFGLVDSATTATAGYASTGAWKGRMAQADTTDVDDSYVEDQLSVAAGSYTATGTSSTAADESTVVVGFKAGVQPVSSVTLSPTTVASGGTSTGTVTLGAPAPSGGAVVTLTSSNTSVATVPVSGTVTVPANATTATFTVTAGTVATTSTASISATYNGSTQSATLTVNPAVASVTLSPATIASGGTSTGTVTLAAPAPTGGAVVTLLSSSTSVATVPASGTVTVPASATTATFTVTAGTVATTSTASISATYNGSTQSAILTVNPAVASVTLSPATIASGGTSTGTVTLGAPAPTGGAVVNLLSSNTSVATVPASGTVTVAASATTATFTVTAGTVATTSTASISATYNGSTQSATLTVNPAGAVAFVRAAGNSGESVKYTVTIAPAAGDFLAVLVWQIEGAKAPTVTDNLGSTYTADCSLTLNQGFGARLLSVYHLLKAGTGITGVSVTPNKPSRAVVAEYSGMASTAGLDVCGTVNNQTTNVTSWSSPATTTKAAKDLVLGLVDSATTATAGYASSGVWNARLAQADTTDVDDSYVEDQLNVAAGSYTATGTSSTAATESTVVVGFKVQ